MVASEAAALGLAATEAEATAATEAAGEALAGLATALATLGGGGLLATGAAPPHAASRTASPAGNR